jgi:pimeloyl-ACP methyl ester carboxylesterase
MCGAAGMCESYAIDRRPRRSLSAAMAELVVAVDGAALAVTYSPAGPAALVAVHGAGDGTRDSSPLYLHLHATLPERGIGVATFDRRGEGASTGDVSRGRFEVQARDALAVAAALGVERVGMWGFSQGGWVAPLAATRSRDVAFVVTVAAPGVSPAEQMRYANRRQLELAGYDAAVVQRALELRRVFEEWVHGAAVSPDLAAAIDEPWFPLLYLPPSLLDDEGRRLWIEEMEFDPRPIFASVGVPVLAFYGERDSWTPVEPSVHAWREATAVVVPGAEHDLTLPNGTIAPLYERTLVAWLSERLQPA